jgi:UDP-N-acetylmuramate--alanine ligase
MGLDSYHGIKRRFEYLGEYKGAKIFDDYAHHPTAVRETLAAARLRFPQSRIWAVFEPHTFSRTEAVLKDLAKSFESANKVLLAEIYPAREKKTDASITGQQVVDQISKNHSDVRLVIDKEEAFKILETELQPTDVVIIMAVGNFNTLGHQLVDLK